MNRELIKYWCCVEQAPRGDPDECVAWYPNLLTPSMSRLNYAARVILFPLPFAILLVGKIIVMLNNPVEMIMDVFIILIGSFTCIGLLGNAAIHFKNSVYYGSIWVASMLSTAIFAANYMIMPVNNFMGSFLVTILILSSVVVAGIVAGVKLAYDNCEKCKRDTLERMGKYTPM
jgi:uncharacterized membrane protein